MVISQNEYMELLTKLDNIAQISYWEKWGIIFSGISSILAVIMAFISFYKSLRCNWMKIKSVKPFVYISDSNSDKVENIGIQIESFYKTDIPVICDIAYVKLSDNLILGFKYRAFEKETINFKQNFELIRTQGSKDYEYGSKMTISELYRKELKPFMTQGKIKLIKSGKVVIFTNVGSFNKKLSKGEIDNFNKIFNQIIEQESIEH